MNESGTIERCNRAMLSQLGRSYAETEGRHLGEMLDGMLHPLLSGGQESGDQEITCGSRHLRARIEPVLFDGASIGSIFLADMTREKLAEQSALMNERLAATGRMANTIAHEINNPLASITNLIFLLKGHLSNSKEAAGYLALAEEEVARVARIAKQILTFHRESATPVWVDLGSLIEDVLALNNRAIVEKDLEVIKEWNLQLNIEGFPAQLRQVFLNIFQNAVDASTKGSRIRIRMAPIQTTGASKEPAVRVIVADNGVGIAKENREKIFDAFFTTKELKGTGIGLWLSSTIVQEHGGRIEIRSSTQPNKSGTSVSVILPVRRASA